MNRSNARLLVVDDNAALRSAICELLNELGFDSIDEAADGVSAWALFQGTAYDVVITDWCMPHGDGIELLRAVRTHPDRMDTPVLLLSANESNARMVEAIEAGANGFIAKPFIAAALCEKLLRVVASLSPVSSFAPAMRLMGGSGLHAVASEPRRLAS